MRFMYIILFITGYHFANSSKPSFDLSKSWRKTHRTKRQIQGNVCEGNLVASGPYSGQISSPNYPRSYIAANCTWLISVLEGQTISVEFTGVDISCRNTDFLKIQDGDAVDSPIILYICGKGKPNPLSSSGQHLFIWFYTSQNSLSNNGFHLTYTAVGSPVPTGSNPCTGSGVQLTQPSGDITSEGFSTFGTGGYGFNLDCRWRIEIPDKHVILLEFESFHLEDSLDCRYDYLKIYDGSSISSKQLANLCGRMSPPPTKSTGRYIYVHFGTDASISGNGFKLKWESLPLSIPNDGKAPGCNGLPAIYNGPSGTITSPYFGPDGNYPPLSDCSYLITGYSRKDIKLVFTSINVETGVGCPYDWIKIYDGPTKNHDLLAGPICGNSLPDIPPSSSNQVLIEFVSDLSRDYKGFQLTWGQTENNNPCSGGGVTLTEPVGTIASPGYGGVGYSDNQSCKWRIQAPVNSQIRLSWKAIDLEPHAKCAYDNVKVFDGYDRSAKLFGAFCGAQLPPQMKSSNNFLYLHFTSDYSVTKSGFILQYDIGNAGVKNDGKNVGCGGTPARLSGSQGMFSAPVIDSRYPSSSQCSWMISAPPEKEIVLSFSNIGIEDHPSCIWDHLKVFQGSDSNGSELRAVCGNENDFTVRGEELYIEFKSDKTFQMGGFMASWKLETSTTGPKKPNNGLQLIDNCGNSFYSVKEERATQWRIIGGSDANPHSLPWQVSLIQDDFFKCGAAILSDKWILTATHCVKDIRASRFHIIAGNHALFRMEGSEQRISVIQKFEHPGYNIPTYDKDIVLLELNTSLTFNEFVQPICLPNSDLPAGTKCIASGWGDTSYPRGHVASNLQQVYVPIIHQSECSAIYDGMMTDNMLCAGNVLTGGIDPCFGDSGGPLACLNDGRWQLQGVISWGSGCAEPGNPGVYTRVTRFLHWIRAITGGNSK